jgi:hypothetical protein
LHPQALEVAAVVVAVSLQAAYTASMSPKWYELISTVLSFDFLNVGGAAAGAAAAEEAKEEEKEEEEEADMGGGVDMFGGGGGGGDY